jgi:hypothetical protein
MNRLRLVVWLGLAAAVIGVFCTWTEGGSVTLNGTQGPNNGWLVVIVAAFALAWSRSMLRGSWVGVAGVLGSAVVIVWTALENWLDNRDVLDMTARYGLVLTVLGGTALGCAALVTGAQAVRRSA